MRQGTFIAAMVLLGSSALVCAQVVSPNANANGNATGSSAPIASAFGNGQAPTLQYSSETGATNQFLFAAGYQFSYDDNVLGASDATKQGDEVHDLNADVRALHAGPRWNTAFEYVPFYELYQQFTQYNRLDQRMSADVTATMTPRLALRMRDTFEDLTNPYGPGLSAGSGLGSPSALNSTIYLPLAAERGNTGRMDLIWNQFGRNTAFVFGGYQNRDFTQIVTSGTALINTQGPGAGAEYSWRATEHTTVGMLYLFERLDFSGALPSGNPSRLDLHGMLPSLGWQPSQTVFLTVFGGPEIANQTIMPVAPSTTSTHDQQIVWSGGGTISGQRERTSWYVTPQRIVADGGGYFSYVINTSVNAAVRQQLPFASRWDATLGFEAARNEAFNTETNNLNLNAITANAQLQHPITERLIANVNYNFTHQTGSQALPTGVEFNRNRVSIGISYQWTAETRARQ